MRPDDVADQLSLSALNAYAGQVCPESYFDELLAALQQHTDEDLPHYTQALKGALAERPPVFARASYAEFFWHCASTVPGWVAQVVLANAQVESQGSTFVPPPWVEKQGFFP